METSLVPVTLRSISHLHSAQEATHVIYKSSVRKGCECMYVIISHRSSCPLLNSGAPQDKRTEVGVSE